jgi:hypothetical protein
MGEISSTRRSQDRRIGRHVQCRTLAMPGTLPRGVGRSISGAIDASGQIVGCGGSAGTAGRLR